MKGIVLVTKGQVCFFTLQMDGLKIALQPFNVNSVSFPHGDKDAHKRIDDIVFQYKQEYFWIMYNITIKIPWA